MFWLKCAICEKEVKIPYRITVPCCSDKCRSIWKYLERIRISSIDRQGLTPKHESIGQGKMNYLED